MNRARKPAPSPNYEGRRLEPYEVKQFIGAGSYGAVYRAWDPRRLKEVAVKILVGIPDGEGTQAKLKQLWEVRIPNVRHPRVIQPFEPVGRTEEGHVYFGMPLIEPSDLRFEIEKAKGGLPWKKAARLVYELADALVAAHKYFIHQDLKPENVLVDKHGNPYIIDFGLAALQEERHQLRTSIAGTWRYMAPEVFRRFYQQEYFDGEPLEPVEARADIYSLGLIFYELLTGRHAFGEMERHERAECIALLPQSPEVLRPDLPIALAQICMRCLAPYLNDRIGSAAELRKELAPFVQAYSWVRWLAVAATVGIVCAVGAAWFLRSPAPPPKSGPPPASLTAPAPVVPNAKANLARASVAPKLTVQLTADENPLAGATVIARSQHLDTRGIHLRPAKTDARGYVTFEIPIRENLLLQVSGKHPSYCDATWNISMDGNSNAFTSKALGRAQQAAILDNAGAATLVLKRAADSLAGMVTPDNQLGMADNGTRVVLLDGTEEAVGGTLRLVHVKIQSGELLGRVGWVSRGALKELERFCP